MRDDFRVCLGCDLMPFFTQGFPEFFIIFDDPVMDNENFAGTIHMRMRINTVRRAMRCPAGMGYPKGTFREGLGRDQGLKILDLAMHFTDDPLRTARRNNPDAT